MSNDRRQRTVWKNLFLVRHGESTANEVNRFAGTVDAPLTSLGEAQARRAGYGWQAGGIDRVYQSPLLRARQTTQILLQTPGLVGEAMPEVIPDPRLSERHFGEFTLKNKTRLQRYHGLRSYEAALYRAASDLHGGESFIQFNQRVLSFLRDEIYPLLREGKRLLIVAHKYVIELLARLILRLPEDKGRDLRLPNASIIPGSRLSGYVRGESALGNWLNDLIAVHHAPVLAFAALLGLGLNAAGLLRPPPHWLLVLLLGLATAISLAHVSFRSPSAIQDPHLLSWGRLIFRFFALPWLVTLVTATPWPLLGLHDPDLLLGVALLMAAPAAVTAVILSRTSGGMILPSVFAVVVSTGMSLANTILLLAFFGQSGLVLQASTLIAVSLFSLVLPAILVHLARQRFPIGVAKIADDHAALAVLALAVFVVLSFQQVTLESLYPNGIVAIGIGAGLRLLALGLARSGSLYGIDDYFSICYPNIFLVIILAGLLGNPVVLEFATWFLVAMFGLAPLDDRLLERLQRNQPQAKLMSYLRVDAQPIGVERSSEWPSPRQAPGVGGTAPAPVQPPGRGLNPYRERNRP